MPGNLLKISFTDKPAIIEALKVKGPRIAVVLATKLTALMQQLASYIVSEKLSGQVLKRRTGVLASSVRAIPTTFQGTQIVGGVESGGGAAFYAAVHEMGGTHAYPIIATKARALRFVMDGKITFAKSVMHPPAIARPFMSTAWAENIEDIKAQLRAAVDEEVNKQ